MMANSVTGEGTQATCLLAPDPAPEQFLGPDVCVPSMVAAQAAAQSKRTAVTAQAGYVNYADLDARANHLAHRLASLGAQANIPIALFLERSIDFVLAALAVFKSGAAYVPIDPASPPARVNWMLKDVRPLAVITTESMIHLLEGGAWQRITLAGEDSNACSLTTDWIHTRPSPDDPAYIIYTSGSTGRPKGVQVTHANLRNLVRWHIRAFNLEATDRASQMASTGFDAAVWEIWPSLCAGASLHIAPDSVRSDPAGLRDWLVSERITTGFVPTPIAERMIGLEWPRETALRILLTGADTLYAYPPPSLPFALVNNYGPTECTVVATSGTVVANPSGAGRPTIGKPIENTQVHILDEQLRPVPSGSAGEICIGGAGVARGYINASDLTAEKFVLNPFDSEGNGRLYRTGDLGTFLPDGQIAFLGRIDEQVKIRGYRIEPNEIVAALVEHSSIDSAVVVSRHDVNGDQQLVAYIFLKNKNNLIEKELRAFLATRLPDYMIPAKFAVLESMPFTVNGKIDRDALPFPEACRTLDTDHYPAPQTPFEERIAEMLESLLGIEKVGTNDNFFMLGGHSLLGTQLIARTREVFGVDLSLRTLFASPTVASLAAEVERLVYLRLESMSDEEVERVLAASAEIPGTTKCL